MSVQEKKSYILQELRKNGCRITNQRQLLIEKDPTIGMATVYRMVKTLEETGLIKRKNLYRIQVEEESA